MKYCLIFLFFFVGNAANAQNENFEVRIIQDSATVKPNENGVVQLQKKIFKIEIDLIGLEGVYLYASFKDNIYKINSNATIPDFKDIPAKSMAEEEFNPSQELIISEDGWAYWFYKPSDRWHRMDKEITVVGNKTTIRKTVKQFYFGDTEENLAVEDNAKTLYLFFLAAKADDNFSLTTEIKRYKLKIQWL
jgi:hypothetical protein